MHIPLDSTITIYLGKYAYNNSFGIFPYISKKPEQFTSKVRQNLSKYYSWVPQIVFIEDDYGIGDNEYRVYLGLTYWHGTVKNSDAAKEIENAIYSMWTSYFIPDLKETGIRELDENIKKYISEKELDNASKEISKLYYNSILLQNLDLQSKALLYEYYATLICKNIPDAYEAAQAAVKLTSLQGYHNPNRRLFSTEALVNVLKAKGNYSAALEQYRWILDNLSIVDDIDEYIYLLIELADLFEKCAMLQGSSKEKNARVRCNTYMNSCLAVVDRLAEILAVYQTPMISQYDIYKYCRRIEDARYQNIIEAYQELEKEYKRISSGFLSRFSYCIFEVCDKYGVPLICIGFGSLLGPKNIEIGNKKIGQIINHEGKINVQF